MITQLKYLYLKKCLATTTTIVYKSINAFFVKTSISPNMYMIE